MAGGNEPTAAGGRKREANEWPWSKSVARKRAITDFGHHNRTKAASKAQPMPGTATGGMVDTKGLPLFLSINIKHKTTSAGVVEW